MTVVVSLMFLVVVVKFQPVSYTRLCLL